VKRYMAVNFRFVVVFVLALLIGAFWGGLAGLVIDAGVGLIVGVVCFVIGLLSVGVLTSASR